jgi:hypothetical protein
MLFSSFKIFGFYPFRENVLNNAKQMGVENKTKNKKKDEMNVKKFKKRRRRLPRLYPHTLSLN